MAFSWTWTKSYESARSLPTGYAIDNDDANDDLIINIQEQDDDKLKDDFIDIVYPNFLK